MLNAIRIQLQATSVSTMSPLTTDRNADVSPILDSLDFAMHLVPGIPSSQTYYWKRAWQDGEAEARAEREAGLAKRFANPNDAIRWLLSSDETE